MGNPEPKIIDKIDVEVKPLKKLEIGDKCCFQTFDKITPKMQETSGWLTPKKPPERSKFQSDLIKLTVDENPYSYFQDNYQQKISNFQKY